MASTRLNPQPIYKDYDLSFNYAAGSIGTRATYVEKDIAQSGYVPVAAVMAERYHCTDTYPILQVEGNVMRALFYRVSTAASSGTLTFRVLYIPS